MISFFKDKILNIKLYALHWGHFYQWHFNVNWIQGLRKLLLLLPSLNNIVPLSLICEQMIPKAQLCWIVYHTQSLFFPIIFTCFSVYHLLLSLTSKANIDVWAPSSCSCSSTWRCWSMTEFNRLRTSVSSTPSDLYSNILENWYKLPEIIDAIFNNAIMDTLIEMTLLPTTPSSSLSVPSQETPSAGSMMSSPTFLTCATLHKSLFIT